MGSRSLEAVRKQAECLRKAANNEADKARQVRAKAWRAHATSMTEGGVGAAHRWTKATEAERQDEVIDNTVLTLQEKTERVKETWLKQVWNRQGMEWTHESGPEKLPRPSVQEI